MDIVNFIFTSNLDPYKLLELDSIKDIPAHIQAICDRFGLPYVSTKQELRDVLEIPREQILINSMSMRDDRVVYYSARDSLEFAAIHIIVATAATTGYWEVIEILIDRFAEKNLLMSNASENEKINYLMLEKVSLNQFNLYSALMRSEVHLAKMIIRSGIKIDQGSYQIALNQNIVFVCLEAGWIGNSDDINQCCQKYLLGSLRSLLEYSVQPNRYTLEIAINSGYYPVIEILVEFGIAITRGHVEYAIEKGLSQIARLLAYNVNSL